MEASESAETEVSGARAAVVVREGERASQDTPRRERLAAARRELGEVRALRAAAAAVALPADLRIYERVASRRRPAVVHLERDSCGGCHLPLGVREAEPGAFRRRARPVQQLRPRGRPVSRPDLGITTAALRRGP